MGSGCASSESAVSSHHSRPCLPAAGLSEPNLKTDVFKFFRERYSGSLMINGGLAIEQGNAYCADGTADLVSFGSPFIANANLPELVAAGYGHGQLNAGECAGGGGHDDVLLASCDTMRVQAARTRVDMPWVPLRCGGCLACMPPMHDGLSMLLMPTFTACMQVAMTWLCGTPRTPALRQWATQTGLS